MRRVLTGIFILMILLTLVPNASAQGTRRVTEVVTDYTGKVTPVQIEKVKAVESCLRQRTSRIHQVYFVHANNQFPDEFDAIDLFTNSGLLKTDILFVLNLNPAKVWVESGEDLTTILLNTHRSRELSVRDYIWKTAIPKGYQEGGFVEATINALEELREAFAPGSTPCRSAVAVIAAPPVAKQQNTIPQQPTATQKTTNTLGIPNILWGLVCLGLIMLFAGFGLVYYLWQRSEKKKEENPFDDGYHFEAPSYPPLEDGTNRPRRQRNVSRDEPASTADVYVIPTYPAQPYHHNTQPYTSHPRQDSSNDGVSRGFGMSAPQDVPRYDSEPSTPMSTGGSVSFDSTPDSTGGSVDFGSSADSSGGSSDS